MYLFMCVYLLQERPRHAIKISLGMHEPVLQKHPTLRKQQTERTYTPKDSLPIKRKTRTISQQCKRLP